MNVLQNRLLNPKQCINTIDKNTHYGLQSPRAKWLQQTKYMHVVEFTPVTIVVIQQRKVTTQNVQIFKFVSCWQNASPPIQKHEKYGQTKAHNLFLCRHFKE